MKDKTHKLHTGKHVDTYMMERIRNVSLTATHTLTRCDCGWFGWTDNSELEEWLVIAV